MSDENYIIFNIELGLLTKYIIDEIKRMAFSYNINCEVIKGGGFLSTIYTIKLISNLSSTITAKQLYHTIYEFLKKYQQ